MPHILKNINDHIAFNKKDKAGAAICFIAVAVTIIGLCALLVPVYVFINSGKF